MRAEEPLATSESLAKVRRWTSDHQFRYGLTELYELGSNDLVFKWAPRDAMTLQSFDLPLRHTHYEFLGQYRRAYLYDVALATVMWSAVGEFDKAKGLLTTLQHLQNDDGSIGFSWNSYGDGFYNRSYKRTGSIAWAGYAGVVYERLSGDKSFRNFIERAANYVLSLQVKDDPEDPQFGLVMGGFGYWSPDYKTLQKRPTQWCCIEHAIDSYFFMRDLHGLTGAPRYLEAATLLRSQMMEVLWDDEGGHFHAAADAEGVNKDLALDASSWGAIFLIAIGETEKARRALAFVDKTYKSSTEGVEGYKAYAGEYRDHPADWTRPDILVWSEGSLGVAAAYLKLGDRDRCEAIVAEIVKMQEANGGVCYTTYSDDLPLKPEIIKKVSGRTPTDPLDEFLRVPSAAGTVWLGLVEIERLKGHPVFWTPDPPEFPAYDREGTSSSSTHPAIRAATAIAIFERGEAAGRISTFVGRGGLAKSRKVTPPDVEEIALAYCEVTCDNSQGGFCGWYVDFLHNPIDASATASLEIVIRGGQGGERLKVGLKDASVNPNADAILVNLPPLSEAWQTLKLPLATFAGLDKSQVASLVLMPDEIGVSTFSVRSVRLIGGRGKRTLDFANRAWQVKRGSRMGPGPNDWSDAQGDIWVDGSGVHMTITQQGDKWQSTEIHTPSEGYGDYVFAIEGDLANIDRNAVFGGFLYRSDTEECDFELSRWGVGGSPNSQFCVQPAAADSLHRFDAGDARELTIHLTWTPGRFRGRCWLGSDTSAKPLADWTYAGDKVPRYDSKMNMHFNFWLFRGTSPITRERQEILIRSFEFHPAN